MRLSCIHPTSCCRLCPRRSLSCSVRISRSGELVREAVLVEAGAPLTHVYLPQSGVICMRNTLLEGQTAEVAMVGPDSVFGASAGLADDVPLTDAVVRLPGIASIAGFRTAADRSATFPNAAGAASTGAVRASPAIRRVQCVAFGRSAAIGLAVACARSNRQRKPAADAGSPGADDRCAALRSIDRRPCAAAGRDSSLQPRSHRNHRCGRGCERRPANATRQSMRNRTG